MTLLRARAPAKVNLALAVTGRRDDGYHTLRSVFCRLELHDELEVTLREDGATDEVTVSGELDVAPADDLVLRASSLLRQLVGQPLPPLRFHLTKRIPVAAGLAGGSSDAAASLDLASEAWGLRLHPAERLEVASRLGADVPFFAARHPAALIHGIGEGLTPLPPPVPAAGLLLVTPAERLATRDVFAEYDRSGPAGGAAKTVAELSDLLKAGCDATALSDITLRLRDANDLWVPAARLSSGLATVRAALESLLDRPFALTGSGPTLFTVYPSTGDAERAAGDLAQRRPDILAGASIHATATAT